MKTTSKFQFKAYPINIYPKDFYGKTPVQKGERLVLQQWWEPDSRDIQKAAANSENVLGEWRDVPIDRSLLFL